MNQGQTDILEGFILLLAELGQMWTRAGLGDTVFGLPGSLQRNDVRMKGAPDRTILIQIAPANLPAPRPKTGETWTKDGKFYRVGRIDFNEASGLWEVLATPAFATSF